MANVGHMVKNRPAHIGHFFPLDPAVVSSLQFKNILVTVYRRDHRYSKEYSVVISFLYVEVSLLLLKFLSVMKTLDILLFR